MGSQEIQNKLWGRQTKDWANIQEKTGISGYEYALNQLELNEPINLLDIGCGSGIFSDFAQLKGISTTGIDACEKLIKHAKQRNPDVHFLEGDMEALPFNNSSFDVVCGFNSFQYAGNIKNAITEAKRVLKDNGKIVVMIWGNKEDCEVASYVKAVGSLLPPPPPGAGGPFALSENQLLERLLEEAGFRIVDNYDVDSVWEYPDNQTALNGLGSSGPITKVIEHTSPEEVQKTILNAIKPYVQPDGTVVYNNKWRVVTATK
ncbi:MAG: methyltransferase domain-containing protein [Aureibaculum sp.]|nr:methyltransferase domain-containing protein [Aureibaculum sp.]